MAENTEFYFKLLNKIGVGIYFVNPDRKITFWNQGAENITGYRSENVLGMSCSENILEHVDAEGRQLCFSGCPLQATIEDGQERSIEVFLKHARGYRLPVEVKAVPISDTEGNVLGAVEIFYDVSPRHEAQKELERLKGELYIDELTGAANRRYFDRALGRALHDYLEYQLPFGVVMVDLDEFKQINDTHGHLGGDEVLRVVSRTLSAVVRSTDLVSRWGGDEFALIIKQEKRSVLERISQQLVEMIAASKVMFEGQGIPVSISVGATLVKPDDTVESLLDRADEALYASKQAGRNCSCVV